GFHSTLAITDASPSNQFDKFTGTAPQSQNSQGRWDSPTFNISLASGSGSYSTQLSTTDNQTCLTLVSMWTSTLVRDQDNDGLLDNWETSGMRFTPPVGTPGVPAGPGVPAFAQAIFGGCAGVNDTSADCVNLPAMGANVSTRDIFIEFDWMHNIATADPEHWHIPKYDALKMIRHRFHLNGIEVHFDVGNNYQGAAFYDQGDSPNAPPVPFIVAANYANGGEVIEEQSIKCPIVPLLPGETCAYNETYSVVNWKSAFVTLKSGGRVTNGTQFVDIPRHFNRNRKDIFHYSIMGHAV